LEFNVPFQHKYGYIRDEAGIVMHWQDAGRVAATTVSQTGRYIIVWRNSAGESRVKPILP